MAEPRLLLVDELSLGLMPKMVDLCLDVLIKLRSEGLSILLVEQNTARALDVADVRFVEDGSAFAWSRDDGLSVDTRQRSGYASF